MNELKLTLDPYRELHTASLNGHTISPYSELSNFIKEPFLDWASILFSTAEREINDNFELTLVSEKFEGMLMSELSKKFPFCKAFNTKPFTVDFLVEKRFQVICKLADKYGISNSLNQYVISLFSDFALEMDETLIMKTKMEDADVCVIQNEAYLKEILDRKKEIIILLISDINDVSVLNRSQYIWKIKKEEVEILVNALIDRFVKIPFITKTAEMLGENKLLSASDLEILKLATAVEPLIKIECAEKIEIGKAEEINISVLPKSVTAPNIRLESQDLSVLGIDGVQIKGLSVGETYIFFYRADEITSFERRKIAVFQDNSIKRISLDRPDPTMGIGKSQKIDISVFPSDAEDANFIVWSVDNTEIASVDEEGVVTAKKSGRIKVTASTAKIQESVIIDILPNIAKITPSVQDPKIMKGDSLPITINYEPLRCFNTDYTWTTSDSNIAFTELLSDGSWMIRTKEPGTCTLTCEATEGNCTAVCSVEVLDPVVEEQKRKQAEKEQNRNIDIACMIGIPVGIFLFIVLIGILLGI